MEKGTMSSKTEDQGAPDWDEFDREMGPCTAGILDAYLAKKERQRAKLAARANDGTDVGPRTEGMLNAYLAKKERRRAKLASRANDGAETREEPTTATGDDQQTQC